MPIELLRTEWPEDWARMVRGELPPAVDVDAFRRRADAAALAGHRGSRRSPRHRCGVQPRGVINLVLHRILGTAKVLSFPIDYTSVTLLRYSRNGEPSVAGVNGVEHVWDLLPRNRPEVR